MQNIGDAFGLAFLSPFWGLTVLGDQPFLTQQLCSHIWERAHSETQSETLYSIWPEDVDTAVPNALDASRNTLDWLWDGLGPDVLEAGIALQRRLPQAPHFDVHPKLYAFWTKLKASVQWK